MEDLEKVPALREDIELMPGAPDNDGFPTWMIYDPVRHQYFTIGWSEFEMLSRWHLVDAEKIIASVNKDTTLQVDQALLQRLAIFLQNNQLVQASGQAFTDHLMQLVDKVHKSRYKKSLTGYLFMRFRLINPDAFLTKTHWFFALNRVYPIGDNPNVATLGYLLHVF